MTTVRQAGSAPRYELRDHWQWRPEWAVDRPCLMWYLTFENQPRLWRAAEELQARLHDVETVDAVPLPWLHLTLEDVGFVDEVAPAQVDEIVDVAMTVGQGWSAPPLTLGPAVPFGSALVLDAGPAAALRELRDRLRACTALAAGPEQARGPRHFRPHVTFGYVNGPCDGRALLERIGDLASGQVVVSVPRLTLAAVTRRNRHYQWTVRAALDFGARRSRGTSYPSRQVCRVPHSG